MAIKRTPLIAGNWKMNLNHLEAIVLLQKLDWTLRDAKHDHGQVETAIFPPFTDLRSVQTLIGADSLPFAYGAQDVSAHDEGAYTGEIAASFLKALEAKYVLVGHSERRSYHQESDDLIGLKAQAALKHGITPVICVGETAEDLEEFGASAVPLRQLDAVLAHTRPSDEIVIAYEPVWAIGSGQAATVEQAEEVAAVLRTQLSETHGQDQADRTRILYGGSVKAVNIAGFMRQPNIDGVLVGGASLDAKEFASIIQYQKHVGL